MKRFALVLGFILVLIGCSSPAPTPTPFVTPTAVLETPFELPTRTPFPLTDPDLLDLKKLLREAVVKQDPTLMQHTISYVKWVGAIYRAGGTPPIDPARGLALTMNFLKENSVKMDLDRTAYEPAWNVPAGDTAVLALVTPQTGDPYYAHFYIEREPSAWRYTGIMTRIPYYDAPSVAQLRANPSKYDGKEYMYVGTYQPKAAAPSSAGTPPADAVFVLDTFSGPLWVSMSTEKYVIPLPADADTAVAGRTVRLFGTIKLSDGEPYLLADSFETVAADKWSHTGGEVSNVNADTLRVTIKPAGGGVSVLQLTETTFITLPDGTRTEFGKLNAGQTVNATGVPQKDGTLLVEELFLN